MQSPYQRAVFIRRLGQIRLLLHQLIEQDTVVCMIAFLKKLKPVASKVWLYATAGLMWSAVGVFLNSLAYGWLQPVKWNYALPLTFAGAALAFTIYYFGFSNLAEKNIRRIHAIKNEKVCLFAFQRWHSYPMVAFFISLGIVLRKYSPIPKPYLAAMYIGIGGSLFLASFHYYKKMVADRVNGRLSTTLPAYHQD